LFNFTLFSSLAKLSQDVPTDHLYSLTAASVLLRTVPSFVTVQL